MRKKIALHQIMTGGQCSDSKPCSPEQLVTQSVG
jgi:hypothetical protein